LWSDPYQIAIAYLEAASGYDFGALNDADPLKKIEMAREASMPASALMFRRRRCGPHAVTRSNPHIERVPAKCNQRDTGGDVDAAPALLVA
jgi:hypothetical protein